MAHHSVMCLIQLADGRLASGSGNNTIKIRNIATEQCVTLSGHDHVIDCLTQLDDGRLVSGSSDKTIKFWDISSRQCVATLSGHSGNVRCINQLSDGRLASASDDNTIKFWDVITGQCVATLRGHSRAVRCIIQLSDGWLASASDDSTIKLWDVASEQCLVTLSVGHSVHSLIQLADGRLASASGYTEEGAIILWQAPLAFFSFEEIEDLFDALATNISTRTLDCSNGVLGATLQMTRLLLRLLSRNKHLTTLNLNNCGLTDTTAKDLLEALEKPSNKIQTVTLVGNAITPSRLATLYQRLRDKFVQVHPAPNFNSNPTQQTLGLNAPLSAETGNTLLHRACRDGDMAEAVDLLNQGADANITNNDLKTPLDIIVNPSSHSELVKLLLKSRPHWQMSTLNQKLEEGKALYKGDFVTREYDKKILDAVVSRLVGHDVGVLMEQWKWVYVGHLNSLKGRYRRHKDTMRKPKEPKHEDNFTNLEGICVENFLPLRIRTLVEFIIKIEKGLLTECQLPKPKQITLQMLREELLIELETLSARRDALFIKNKLGSVETYIEAHAQNLTKKIQEQTQRNRSYCYYSGYIEHSVYINFTKQTVNGIQKIVPRVDNVGFWVNCGKHELERTNYYYPCALDVPVNYFDPSKPTTLYIINIIKAQFESKAFKAYSMIYATQYGAEEQNLDKQDYLKAKSLSNPSAAQAQDSLRLKAALANTTLAIALQSIIFYFQLCSKTMFLAGGLLNIYKLLEIVLSKVTKLECKFVGEKMTRLIVFITGFAKKKSTAFR